MPTYPNSRLNKECRKVYLPYIFGQAVSDVPPQDGVYAFRVLRMEITQPDMESLKHLANLTILDTAIYYKLEPTDQVVEATNSGGVKVRRGNKVMLVLSKLGYDIHMDCTEYRTGLVIEPCRPMLMPFVQPNFAGTDSRGVPYSNADLVRSLSYRNALCAGTLAVEGQRYYPIQGTYRGGERYYDSKGKVCFRLPGELRWTKDDPPKRVYLMRRELWRHPSSHTLARTRMSLQLSGSSGDVSATQYYLDDPFFYKYINGDICPIGLPPNSVRNFEFGEQAYTTNIEEAQYAYDLFLCPKQAEGEPIPPNTLVSVAAEKYTTYAYPFRNKLGQEIDPVKEAVVNRTTTRYFEVLPPTDTYYTKLEGQARTYGLFFTVGFDPSQGDYPYAFEDKKFTDLITVLENTASVQCSDRKVYANALLGGDGFVQLHYKGKVVNRMQFFPCRGVFRIKTYDTVFDVLFLLNVDWGYGVPRRISYPTFDKTTGRELRDRVNFDKYYTIVRRLVDPLIGKYVLELQPAEPYTPNALLET